MKPRDLAIVGAVLLIGAFAVFDALRDGRGESGVARAPTAPTAISNRPEDTTTQRPVSLSGRLVYTDQACSIHEADVVRGAVAERFPDGTCGLWGPAETGRIAYAFEALADNSIRFRVIDLDAPGSDYGSYRALYGSIVWSPDGSRVAWCDERRRGWELVLRNEELVRLPACPIAYSRFGEPAFVRGQSLFLGRALTPARDEAPGRISAVSFGNDGSLALVVRDEAFRYGSINSPVALAHVPLRDPYRDSPVFAPDNCAALLRSPHTGQPPRVTVISLGCERRVDRRVVPGNEAAWSPDGAWFAVAEPTGIFFHTPAGATAPDGIAEVANQLLWKEAR